MQILHKALTNTAVFLMIFVRPEKLTFSFDAIRKARPRQLLIVSDGPRNSHLNDKRLNDECKSIVQNIDWECEILTKYSPVNQGMFVTGYEGLKWAFEQVEELIFLEDDVVPNQTFFRFCDTLLHKYRNDSRISMICGMNQKGKYPNENADYFFSKIGSIWGFAIWKRTFEQLEFDMAFVDNPYTMKLIESHFTKGIWAPYRKKIIAERNNWVQNNIIGSFEGAHAAAMILNSNLVIVPTQNMINCIGISANAGHNVDHPLKLPKRTRRLFNMETFELENDLIHPKYIVTNDQYRKLVLKSLGKNSLFRFLIRLERVVRRFYYGRILNVK